jgi:E3 ubiquitin-protein ligase RNF146
MTTLQELHCSHKYCILCVKGLINTTPKCPVCRAVITGYNSNATAIAKNKYQSHVWLYHGRDDSWWIFDDELQEKLSHAKTSFTWLLSGQQMHFDVVNMVQENLETRSIRYIKKNATNTMTDHTLNGIAGVPFKRDQS